MDVLGSVKNRIKTMRIINRNKKLKLKKDSTIAQLKKEVVIKKVKLNQEIIINKTLSNNKNYNLRKIAVFLPSTTIKKESIYIFNSKKVGKRKQNKTVFKEPKKEILNKTHILNKEKTENIKSKNIVEEKILDIFKSYVKESKQEIKVIKKTIEKEEKNLKEIKTQKQLEEFQSNIEKIKEKINYLKNTYEGIISKYEFLGFHELNDSLLSKYIDDFKFKMPITEIDLLVENCKNEVTYLEEINNLIEKIDKIVINEENKKVKIRYLDNDYYNRMVDYDKLLEKENKINRYLEKEEEYLINLEKEIGNNSLDITKSSRLIFNKEYINNLYKLNIGLSIFNTTYIGAFIGAFLIKNSLTPLLLRAFDRKEITKYTYKYKEYTNKITDNLSIVKQTNFLLIDSLKDIKRLKKHMEIEYKEYLKVSNYNELYKKIVNLENDLVEKQNKCSKIEQNLLKQKNKNNEKQIKLREIIKNN